MKERSGGKGRREGFVSQRERGASRRNQETTRGPHPRGNAANQRSPVLIPANQGFEPSTLQIPPKSPKKHETNEMGMGGAEARHYRQVSDQHQMEPSRHAIQVRQFSTGPKAKAMPRGSLFGAGTWQQRGITGRAWQSRAQGNGRAGHDCLTSVGQRKGRREGTQGREKGNEGCHRWAPCPPHPPFPIPGFRPTPLPPPSIAPKGREGAHGHEQGARSDRVVGFYDKRLFY